MSHVALNIRPISAILQRPSGKGMPRLSHRDEWETKILGNNVKTNISPIVYVMHSVVYLLFRFRITQEWKDVVVWMRWIYRTIFFMSSIVASKKNIDTVIERRLVLCRMN